MISTRIADIIIFCSPWDVDFFATHFPTANNVSAPSNYLVSLHYSQITCFFFVRVFCTPVPINDIDFPDCIPCFPIFTNHLISFLFEPNLMLGLDIITSILCCKCNFWVLYHHGDAYTSSWYFSRFIFSCLLWKLVVCKSNERNKTLCNESCSVS